MDLQLTLDAETGTSPPPASSPDLEPAVAALEAELQLLATEVAQLVRRVKRAQAAARVGQVRDMARLIADMRSTAGSVAAGCRDIDWEFEVREHLATGAFVNEVVALAEASGLGGVRELNGELLSYPLVVRADAAESSIVMGKRRERGIRPSHIVSLLKQARQKQTAGAQLLPAIERAYLLRTNQQTGVAVPLHDLYEVLTLRPGQTREYTELDFLVGIYTLDKSGPHTTRSGYRVSFPAATTTRNAKRRSQIVTELGEEKTYSTVRLDRVTA